MYHENEDSRQLMPWKKKNINLSKAARKTTWVLSWKNEVNTVSFWWNEEEKVSPLNLKMGAWNIVGYHVWHEFAQSS